VRHPAYIALERFQKRKGEDWGTDSVGGEQGKESDAGVGKKKVSNTWAHGISVSRERKAVRA
jgi:hypothetical protein